MLQIQINLFKLDAHFSYFSKNFVITLLSQFMLIISFNFNFKDIMLNAEKK